MSKFDDAIKVTHSLDADGRALRGISGCLISQALLVAIRHWAEDTTNYEPWREATRPAESLMLYLDRAGFEIVPTARGARERADRARARRAGRVGVARENGMHTDDQWKQMLAWARYSCVKCAIPFSDLDFPTKDHIIPVAEGGDDTIQNIQPLCVSCNASKGTNTADYRKPGWWEALL